MISNTLLEGELRTFLTAGSTLPAAGVGGPRISIVMPSYNAAPYIERAILSVLNQGWADVELIIIDGGSTDGTVDVIQRYENRLAYWRSQKDRGQSDALNAGFARATGQIFGWLNADDLYYPGAFARAAQALANPRTSLVYGDWLNIDGKDKVTFRSVALPPSLPLLIADGFQFNLQATFWKPALHPRPEGFDVRLHRTMDYDFAVTLLRGVKRDQVAVLPWPLGCFRLHPDQKTQGLDATVMQELRLIAERHDFPWVYTWRAKPVRAYSKLVKIAVWLRRGAFQELERAASNAASRITAAVRRGPPP